jgi:hypothetical protein
MYKFAIIAFVATAAVAQTPKQCPPGQALSCVTVGPEADRNVQCTCSSVTAPPPGTCAMQLTWVGGKQDESAVPAAWAKLPPCPKPEKAKKAP